MQAEADRKFAEYLSALNITLPLRIAKDDAATVVDAAGCEVFTADANGTRSDDEACVIAEFILGIINCLGGFKPERTDVQ